MTETLANGYSSEITLRELSNEYQHDRVKMFFKNLCLLVLWTKVASALKGLIHSCLGFPCEFVILTNDTFGSNLVKLTNDFTA